MSHSFDIDWSFFLMVEFLESLKINEAEFENKMLLDIGSGAGTHSEIFKAFGLEVVSIDKYSKTADINADYLGHNFEGKFDFIFCSHVIEHQRNCGLFLDKLYDDLSEEGQLLLSAPKHSASTLIEGHINCFKMPILLQQLIYAGFDLRKSAVLSIKGLENSVIAAKDPSFDYIERADDAFCWSAEQQNRSFIPLKSGSKISEDNFFYNCSVFSTGKNPDNVSVNLGSSQRKGLEIISSRFGLKAVL